MTRQELAQWLGGPAERLPSPAEIAALLDVPLTQIADTTLMRTAARLRALCFTIAVLRDVFPEDGDVRGWLRRPRMEAGGRSAVELLLAGRTSVVEELAVREWHCVPAAAVCTGAGGELARA